MANVHKQTDFYVLVQIQTTTLQRWLIQEKGFCFY